MLLVARLRSDHPFGALPLTCDDPGETYILEGKGEITAAKLLDLANRRQLVWEVDEATRERVLAAASARIQRDRDTAKRVAAARAAATVAAAVPAARKASGKPPGVPPAPTASSAPGEIAHEGGRVVWSEPPVAEPGPHQTARVAPPRRRRLWLRTIVAIACVAAVASGLFVLGQIALGPAPSPAARVTNYTELSFTDPATLPTRLSVREPNLLSFTVFNHEGRKRVYQYVVTLASARRSSVVERGSIVIEDNAEATRVVNVVPTGRHGSSVITVTITDPRQAIHFTGNW